MAKRHRDHSNRMQMTVIMLVASMTSGAFVLNWLHGRLSPRDSGLNTTTLLSRSHDTWTRIEIQTWTDRSGPIPFHHLYIDEAGREFPSLAWRQAEREGDPTGTIQLLLAPPRAGGIPVGQWQTLIRRVRELNVRYNISPRQITVQAGADAMSAQAKADLQELAQMLRTAGLVG